MVFKNCRKTNRKIRECFITIFLHLGSVNSNQIGKTYSLVKLMSFMIFFRTVHITSGSGFPGPDPLRLVNILFAMCCRTGTRWPSTTSPRGWRSASSSRRGAAERSKKKRGLHTPPLSPLAILALFFLKANNIYCMCVIKKGGHANYFLLVRKSANL